MKSLILCTLLRLATATDEHCSQRHPYKASPADALDSARVTRSTVARWARTRRNWVKRWDGRASALAMIARDDASASLCTPPKSGSTALFARFRRAKRVDWLNDEEKIYFIFINIIFIFVPGIVHNRLL